MCVFWTRFSFAASQEVKKKDVTAKSQSGGTVGHNGSKGSSDLWEFMGKLEKKNWQNLNGFKDLSVFFPFIDNSNE